MATQNLSMAHVAIFDEQNGLLIKATDDESASVALTREEVAALHALITPAITDGQINELLNELQNVTNAFYCSATARRVIHHQAVRDWLVKLDQPSGLAVSSSESEVCEWRVSDFGEGEYWATGCGNGWCVDSDGEELRKDYVYCPSCGKRVRYVEEKE